MRAILATNIIFPNLGIELENVGSGFDIFGFRITFYAIAIAIGMLCGWLLAERVAKATGQNAEIYLDFALVAIISSVIGARLYYVVFAFEEFEDRPWSILNLRTGGLAIYGGIIAGVLAAIIFAKVKKYPFWLLADTACIGLVTGQIIGRWGNFFNREAFGKYTDGLLAMQLNVKDVSRIYRNTMSLTELEKMYRGKEEVLERILEIRNKTVTVGDAIYIQVHPTFLYESVWNLVLLIFLLLYTKHKKFDGEIMLLYLIGYGAGRVWVEGLRTDQLFLWGTPFAVSQILSAFIVVICLVLLIYKRKRAKVRYRF